MNIILRPVNFKQAYGVRTEILEVNPFITIQQFIETTIPILSTLFIINETEIEIVESGQGCIEYPAELAPAIIPSTTLLSQKWGEKLKNLSFYVRVRNQTNSIIDPIRQFNAINTRNDCPICLELCVLSYRYNCNHGVCSNCYSNCIASSIYTCSLCRSL